MELIKVVVHGVVGKMGREVLNALCHEPGLAVVAGVEQEVSAEELSLPDGSGMVPFSSDLGSIIDRCHPDVLVDFTIAEATRSAVPIATGRGVNLVIGTTGLSQEDLAEIDRLATACNVGAIVAPNFALGAVLMMHLAKVAARYLDYAEIIEMHHERKVDAPSGTAISTARAMLEARGKPFSQLSRQEPGGSRGEQIEGVTLHSVRLPGLLAHQEVLLGEQVASLQLKLVELVE